MGAKWPHHLCRVAGSVRRTWEETENGYLTFAVPRANMWAKWFITVVV